MPKEPTINACDLPLFLRYDPETGRLFWLQRTPDMFKRKGRNTPEHSCKIWNANFAFKEALCVDHSMGYRYGRLGGKGILAHRVVFAFVKGFWPKFEVDHIDGDRRNNRIENLRDVNHTENSRNATLSSRSASGVTGVYFDRGIKRWRARITVNRKGIHLGCFDSIEDARTARIAANQRYGFSTQHGKAQPRLTG